MQKHHFIFLFFFLILFAFSETALAAVCPLPRCQKTYTSRIQEANSKSKIEITCSSKGGVSKGTNQTCSGPISGVNNCYSRCWCPDEYKKYTDADKGTGKACESLSNPCTEGSTTYYKTCNKKYCASINNTYLGEDKKSQLSSFFFAFTPVSGITGQDGQCYTCSCPDDWRTDYYVDNADKWDTCTTSGFSPCSGSTKYRITKCVNGYKLVNKDTPKSASCTACAKGEYSTGTNCIKCTYGTYADNTGTATCKSCPAGWTIASTKVLGATSVETACKKCPAGTYKSGTGSGACTACPAAKPSSPEGSTSESACVSTCISSSCTATLACQGDKCAGFSSIQITNAGQIGNGVSAYKNCTAVNCSDTSYQHGYLVTACKTDKDGWSINSGKTNCECAYSSNDAVYKYVQAECANATCSLGCNDKYKFNTCNGAYYGVDIGDCPTPQSTDCRTLGYQLSSCATGKTAIACPFDKSKVACF